MGKEGFIIGYLKGRFGVEKDFNMGRQIEEVGNLEIEVPNVFSDL